MFPKARLKELERRNRLVILFGATLDKQSCRDRLFCGLGKVIRGIPVASIVVRSDKILSLSSSWQHWSSLYSIATLHFTIATLELSIATLHLTIAQELSIATLQLLAYRPL